jgi:hypothetical protein
VIAWGHDGGTGDRCADAGKESDSMSAMSGAESKVWTIEVDIAENVDETRAVARLNIAGQQLSGFGRAKRNPADPSLPRVGEELATARALSELTQKLLEEAAGIIEGHEGEPPPD